MIPEKPVAPQQTKEMREEERLVVRYNGNEYAIGYLAYSQWKDDTIYWYRARLEEAKKLLDAVPITEPGCGDDCWHSKHEAWLRELEESAAQERGT